jgi:hypothetical protein
MFPVTVNSVRSGDRYASERDFGLRIPEFGLQPWVHKIRILNSAIRNSLTGSSGGTRTHDVPLNRRTPTAHIGRLKNLFCNANCSFVSSLNRIQHRRKLTVCATRLVAEARVELAREGL